MSVYSFDFNDPSLLDRKLSEEEKELLFKDVKKFKQQDPSEYFGGKAAAIFVLKGYQEGLFDKNSKVFDSKLLLSNLDKAMFFDAIKENKLPASAESALFFNIFDYSSTSLPEDKAFTFEIYNLLETRYEERSGRKMSYQFKFNFLFQQLLSIDAEKDYTFDFSFDKQKEKINDKKTIKYFNEQLCKTLPHLLSPFLVRAIAEKTGCSIDLLVPAFFRVVRKPLKALYYVPPHAVKNFEDAVSFYPDHVKPSDFKLLTRLTGSADYFEKLDDKDKDQFLLASVIGNASLLEKLAGQIDEKLIVKAYATFFDKMIKTPTCRTIWQKHVMMERVTEAINDKPEEKFRRKI